MRRSASPGRVYWRTESDITQGFTAGAALGIVTSYRWILIKSWDLTCWHGPSPQALWIIPQRQYLLYSLSPSLDFQFYFCLPMWREQLWMFQCARFCAGGRVSCAHGCCCVLHMTGISPSSFGAVVTELRLFSPGLKRMIPPAVSSLLSCPRSRLIFFCSLSFQGSWSMKVSILKSRTSILLSSHRKFQLVLRFHNQSASCWLRQQQEATAASGPWKPRKKKTKKETGSEWCWRGWDRFYSSSSSSTFVL